MIPKIIHYCWFGKNSLPEMARMCINSWKKFCPNYQIIEWNEDNFDINYNDYVREAYEAKKWAFVSDVVRLYVLVNYGGIYMDTDVELIKPLDELLEYDALSGFETKTQIPTGLMACQKGQVLFKELLEDYDNVHFKRADGTFDMTTNVIRITNICTKYGLILNNEQQTIRGFTLLPCEYLCPKDYITKKMTLTEKTVCIHHFDGSWVSEEDRNALRIQKKLCKFLPRRLSGHVAKGIVVYGMRGIKGVLSETIQWMKRRHHNVR